MKYFRHPETGEVFAFELDGSQDEFIPVELVRMNADEIALHLTPKATPVSERNWRDGELASLVWLRDRHRDQLEIGAPATLTPEQFMALLEYMQSLRDWPQAEAFPDSAQRPVAPPWIAEQTQ
ncbi:phage tail assembly chaperone [Pseudomonas sp. microsymbiont 2]